MARYRLRLDGVVEATDVDEVIAKVADHFKKLSCGVIPADLFLPGTEASFKLEPERPRRAWREVWGRFDNRGYRSKQVIENGSGSD